MSEPIRIKLKGLDKLQRLMETAPARTRAALLKARLRSAFLIQRAAKEEAPVDKGPLRASINIRHLSDAAIIAPGTNYALAVHEGTGIYGPKKTPIRPKNGKVLAWRSGSGWIFARSIKGQKPNRFMARAAKAVTPAVQREFDHAIEQVTKGR